MLNRWQARGILGVWVNVPGQTKCCPYGYMRMELKEIIPTNSVPGKFVFVDPV